MKKKKVVLLLLFMINANINSFFNHKKITWYASISLRKMTKPLLKCAKKIVFDRSEIFYCASAYLAVDALIIPKQANNLFPMLGYCKTASLYLVAGWLFYACFIGDALDEIHKQLYAIKNDTSSIDKGVKELENIIQKIDKNIEINTDDIKEIKDLVSALESKVNSIDELCSNTNTNVQKILEKGADKSDLKNLENILLWKTDENTKKIISAINQNGPQNAELKQQLAAICRLAVSLSKMVLELNNKKIII